MRLDDWTGVWAADNDAFNGGFDPVAYMRMLHKYKTHQSTCMWVAAPDVVGVATSTLELFYEWAPVLEEWGYPVALVGQDGMSDDLPWDMCDAFFIGGSTEWKLGAAARQITRSALDRGKLVHMGRVNSRRRIKYAKSIGCHSVDGTAVARYTATHLPNYLEWAAAPTQLNLGGR